MRKKLKVLLNEYITTRDFDKILSFVEGLVLEEKIRHTQESSPQSSIPTSQTATQTLNSFHVDSMEQIQRKHHRN